MQRLEPTTLPFESSTLQLNYTPSPNSQLLYFPRISALFGASFFSYQWHVAKYALWGLIVSVYTFSSLGILCAFYKPKTAVQKARPVFQSYTSLKVTVLVGMKYYSMHYIPKEVKVSVYCLVSNIQSSQIPRVGWLGTAALSQYSGDPALLPALSGTQGAQLGPVRGLHHPWWQTLPDSHWPEQSDWLSSFWYNTPEWRKATRLLLWCKLDAPGHFLHP